MAFQIARLVTKTHRAAVAAVLLLAATCGCRNMPPPASPGPGTDGAPQGKVRERPTPPTAAPPAEAPSAASPSAADTAPQPPAMRVLVATTNREPLACAAPSSQGIWVAYDAGQGLVARELAVGASATEQTLPLEGGARADTLQCGSGGQAFWLSLGRGQAMAVVTKAGVRRVQSRASVLGLAAQTDGSAVIVAATADSRKVELVRLSAQLEPMWQRELPTPGDVTAVATTLRDDVVLVGRKPTGVASTWWLLRAGQRDGLQAWTRELDPTVAPSRFALVGATQSPTGVLLAFESQAPAQSKSSQGWALLHVDANGTVGARSVVPQRAPRLVVAGSETAAIWAQERGAGLILERAVGYGLVDSATAPWPGPETPLGLAVARDGAWWAISAGSHPAGDVWTLLATRMVAVAPAAAPGPDPACVARWAVASAQKGTDINVALEDGSPCGPAAVCRSGQCRPVGR